MPAGEARNDAGPAIRSKVPHSCPRPRSTAIFGTAGPGHLPGGPVDTGGQVAGHISSAPTQLARGRVRKGSNGRADHLTASLMRYGRLWLPEDALAVLRARASNASHRLSDPPALLRLPPGQPARPAKKQPGPLCPALLNKSLLWQNHWPFLLSQASLIRRSGDKLKEVTPFSIKSRGSSFPVAREAVARARAGAIMMP